jgi:IS4 transposase
MAALEAREPLFVDSLLGAIRRLEAARTPRTTREAVRDCALAIEFRLDTLARELDPARGQLDPSLVPAGRAVERELREVLVEAWRLLEAGDEALVDRARLGAFARAAARAAQREAAFAFAQLALPEALD